MKLFKEIKKPDDIVIASALVVSIIILIFAFTAIELPGPWGQPIKSIDNIKGKIKTIGGSRWDSFSSVTATSDGGFVAVGTSNSNDGDIPGNKGFYDGIIFKFSRNGKLLWAKNVGGSDYDEFFSVAAAPDGGFVAVGVSESGNGDIPENKGSKDAIIARFDENGDLLWVESIGGSENEIFYSVTQTSDGGFVAVGVSNSNDGDLPSNKGNNDAIIAKYNENGDFLWIKNVGGSEYDEFRSVTLASDGGFVAVGTSRSNDGDIPGNNETFDAIIVKFSENGSLLWVKTINGNVSDALLSVTLTSEGEFVAVGTSSSSIGDIPGNKGSFDAIIVKFDENGNLLWGKSIGGIGDDSFNSVTQARDGGFIAVGASESGNGDIPGNIGSKDAIIAKFDENGDLLWVESIGGERDDSFNFVIRARDRGFIVIGYTSSFYGDISGNKGFDDAIIAKFG